MDEWMNEAGLTWMNEWKNKWSWFGMNEWMNEWKNESSWFDMNEWMKKWMNEAGLTWMKGYIQISILKDIDKEPRRNGVGGGGKG